MDNSNDTASLKISPPVGFKEAFILHLADNALILSQRNSEWCGHGPVLEQDIAITNISLDLIGQARNFYQYAADLRGDGSTEDSLAYLRTEREFKNCLLVEQPNIDWGQTILRQFFFSAYEYYLFQQWQEDQSGFDDEHLLAIAVKSLKEVRYHLRWSSEWVIRLGDGTEESHQRMLKAIDNLWPYTGELFVAADYEESIGINFNQIKEQWVNKVKEVFSVATLPYPPDTWMHSGGKSGTHSEHLGYILTELQFMQRVYPNSEW